jgi:hypothetical protein
MQWTDMGEENDQDEGNDQDNQYDQDGGLVRRGSWPVASFLSSTWMTHLLFCDRPGAMKLCYMVNKWNRLGMTLL